MGIYLNSFTSYLYSQGMTYKTIDNNRVFIKYDYEDHEYGIEVYFVDDYGHVKFSSWGIGSFKGKEYIGNQVCNTMNNRYPSFNFSIDKDGDVCVSTEINTSYSNAGKAVTDMTQRIVLISSFALYDFNKARS